MKFYALTLGLVFAGTVSASRLQYAGNSGRLQNLSATPNAELEIVVELSECGQSWYPGSDNWCHVKTQSTSNIDSLGNFRLRSASTGIGSSNWGTTRAYLRKINSPQFYNLSEIKMEILKAGLGMTYFAYPSHPIEILTNEGSTLSDWNRTEFGPGRVTITRTFKDLAGNELVKVQSNNLTETSETILTMPEDNIIIPRFMELGTEFKLMFSISPAKKSGEGIILSEETFSLKTEKPQISALPTKLTLNTKVMNYSIDGSYKIVSVDLSSPYDIGKSASFSCKSGKLTGEMDIQGEKVSVSGTCSKGKAEFYLETIFWNRNFKGTVRFDKIVNRSVCGQMTDILENNVGSLCLVRAE